MIALLFVTAWALRGYLPGIEPVADRERPTSSPAALVVDVALLGISVAIIGFAIISRLRNRQARRPAPGQLPEGRGAMGRPTWRFSLIALRPGHRVAAARDDADADGRARPGRSAACRVADGRGPWQRATAPPIRCRGNRIRRTTRVPNIIGYLVPPMLILMALIVVGTAVASRRQRRAATSWAALP